MGLGTFYSLITGQSSGHRDASFCCFWTVERQAMAVNSEVNHHRADRGKYSRLPPSAFRRFLAWYLWVSVSTFTWSPTLMNSGTLMSRPHPSLASFGILLLWTARHAGMELDE